MHPCPALLPSAGPGHAPARRLARGGRRTLRAVGEDGAARPGAGAGRAASASGKAQALHQAVSAGRGARGGAGLRRQGNH